MQERLLGDFQANSRLQKPKIRSTRASGPPTIFEIEISDVSSSMCLDGLTVLDVDVIGVIFVLLSVTWTVPVTWFDHLMPD